MDHLRHGRAAPGGIRRVVFADAPLPGEKLYTFPVFTPQGEALLWHFSFFNVKDQFAEKMSVGKERLLVEQNIKSHATKTDWPTPATLDLYGGPTRSRASCTRLSGTTER